MLLCPLCKANCVYGLYIHQFDPEDDDCCYFSCVTCISKLHTKVGVPAKQWERWDESDIDQHSKESRYPCTINTREIMEKAKPKRKRKRTKGKAKPTPTHTVDIDTVDVGEMIEKIHLYIQY